jgi:hypothetical protein
LESGQPTGDLVSILHWAVAEAMLLKPEDIRVLSPHLITVSEQHVPGQAQATGIILSDVAFDFCASGADALPGGATFEHRFAVAAQGFEAFSLSSIRFLEIGLQSVTPSEDPHSSEGAQEKAAGPDAVGGDEEKGQGEAVEFRENILLWLGTAILVALVGVVLSALQLARVRRLRRRREKEQREAAYGGDALNFMPALPVDVRERSPSQQAGGLLASVTCAFDALGVEADATLAAAAGLDPAECLRVSEGDTLEIISHGESWLYGRRLAEGDGESSTFGFVPEALSGPLQQPQV